MTLPPPGLPPASWLAGDRGTGLADVAPALSFYLDTEPQAARCRECDIAAERIIRDLITAAMSAIIPRSLPRPS